MTHYDVIIIGTGAVINPLDEFRLVGDRLEFTNLLEKYGFVTTESRYRASWSTYDNDAGSYQPVSTAPEPRTNRNLEIPRNVDPRRFLVAEIHTINAENPHWNTAVRVYLRPSASRYEIVGIERERPEKSTFPMD